MSEKLLEELFNECTQNTEVCSLIAQHQNVLSVYMKYCTFDYLIDVRKIGVESVNGFNLLLTYYKEFNTDITIESSCILESSKHQNADNLLYEYFVGRYFNKRINQHFPFFVTTHGLYKYTDDGYQYVKNNYDNNKIHINLLKQAIELRQCKVI